MAASRRGRRRRWIARTFQHVLVILIALRETSEEKKNSEKNGGVDDWPDPGKFRLGNNFGSREAGGLGNSTVKVRKSRGLLVKNNIAHLFCPRMRQIRSPARRTGVAPASWDLGTSVSTVSREKSKVWIV